MPGALVAAETWLAVFSFEGLIDGAIHYSLLSFCQPESNWQNNTTRREARSRITASARSVAVKLVGWQWSYQKV